MLPITLNLIQLLEIWKIKHGAACTLRTFVSKCKRCGAPVLYWECIHGCKVFFQYPVYGKLIRHRCARVEDPSRQEESEIAEREYQQTHKQFFQCPVCAKNFTTERQLDQHIKEKKNIDDAHHNFFLGGQYFDQINAFVNSPEYKQGIGIPVKKFQRLSEEVKFGKIVFKKNREDSGTRRE